MRYILFLPTEPTSGLDSYTAFSIVQILKKMADRNTAVLLTIHQPSSEIFFLFDIVVFMKEGRIFYQGPAADVATHFASLGQMCPENYNPCDFVMTLTQVDSCADLEAKGLFMKTPAVEEPMPSPNSKTKRSGSIDLALVDETAVAGTMAATSGFMKQLSWLIQREYQNLTRNKAGLGARFGVTIFLNLLFGFIFMNAGSRDNANPVSYNTHFGALTMASISSMFGSAQPTMLEFPFERPMFMREYVTGTCKS